MPPFNPRNPNSKPQRSVRLEPSSEPVKVEIVREARSEEKDGRQGEGADQPKALSATQSVTIYQTGMTPEVAAKITGVSDRTIENALERLKSGQASPEEISLLKRDSLGSKLQISRLTDQALVRHLEAGADIPPVQLAVVSGIMTQRALDVEKSMAATEAEPDWGGWGDSGGPGSGEPGTAEEAAAGGDYVRAVEMRGEGL